MHKKGIFLATRHVSRLGYRKRENLKNRVSNSQLPPAHVRRKRMKLLGAIPRCARTVSVPIAVDFPHNLVCYLLELAFSLFLLGQNAQRGSNT